MYGAATDPSDAEMLSLLDVEPMSIPEVAEIAKRLLQKMNRKGISSLSVDEQVQLRLIRAVFE